MASQNSLILRNANARQRLNNAAAALREKGYDIPDFQTTHRDEAVARAQELEYFASIMETVAGVTPAQSQADADGLAEEAAIVASETGEAVEDTEIAQSVPDAPAKPNKPASKGTSKGAPKRSRK